MAAEATSPAVADPTPASAPPPPYDLSGDLAARLADARALGALGPAAVSDVESSVFLFVAARGGYPFDAEVDLARRALPPLFHGRFVAPPPRAITVFVFPSTTPYDAFCHRRYGHPCSPAYARYDDARRELVVDVAPGGPTTLTHELVHPIVASDFPGAPLWFDEGLATLYEIPITPAPGEITAGPNRRHDVLVSELKHPTSGEVVALDRLFAMTRETFTGKNEWLHYAVAHDFCWWMEKRGKLWAFYRTWREHADKDGSGRWSFKQVVGESVEEANGEWLAWVRQPT